MNCEPPKATAPVRAISVNIVTSALLYVVVDVVPVPKYLIPLPVVMECRYIDVVPTGTFNGVVRTNGALVIVPADVKAAVSCSVHPTLLVVKPAYGPGRVHTSTLPGVPAAPPN